MRSPVRGIARTIGGASLLCANAVRAVNAMVASIAMSRRVTWVMVSLYGASAARRSCVRPSAADSTSHPATTGSRTQRDAAKLESHRLQDVKNPSIQRIGASIDHHVDQVLRLVLLLALDNCEKHLTCRIGDREVHPALCHLEYHHGCDTSHERQCRETNNVDCW